MPDWLAILKAYVDSLETIVGTEGGVALADKLTAARAGYLNELSAANIPTDIDGLKTSRDRQLFTLDLWSTYTAQISLTTGAGDKTLQNITITNIPAGATVVRAIMMFKCRSIANTNALVNSLSGAQNIQCQKAVGGAYITGIALAGGEFSVASSSTEGGDVLMGTSDVSAQVPANAAVMNFKWTNALAAQNNLNFNDIQIGLRIWYSV